MKRFFIQKISGLLILSLVLSSFYFIKPKEVEAQYAVVEVGASLFQQTIIAANTTQLAFNAYSDNLKEFWLDGIAGMFAKQIIRHLTQSVVNWINTGFEGSPSFVQNPSSFFLDVADQETGRFLNKYGGPLADLCSPFSIDLRISLAFKYHPNNGNRYSCTLGTIIGNTQNAIEGASINGFTAGDFRQGGWPAFISLTTEPQNNIYGAWVEADTELSLRVANIQIARRDELNQGRGFLSWRDPKCKAETEAFNAKVTSDFQALEDATGEDYARLSNEMSTRATAQNLSDLENASGADYRRESARIGGDLTQQRMKNVNDCPVKTPGSFIVNALESSADGPLHELQLADELNEIVNALFAQLVTQILTKGLSAASGSGAGDSSAYINQIINESPEGAMKITEQMLPNLSTHISNTQEYKAQKDASLTTILEAKTSFDAARACYENKLATQTNLSTSDRGQGQYEITQINQKIAQDITPIATRLLGEAQAADARLKSLLDIQASSTAAKTVNDLRAPSEKYSQLLQTQSITSPAGIQAAKTELAEVKTKSDELKQQAQRKIQECALFPSFRF